MSNPGGGVLRGKGEQGVAAVTQTETNLNKGRQVPTWKEAVGAAAIVFVVVFLICVWAFDWIYATGLATFMALFTGVLAMEGKE